MYLRFVVGKDGESHKDLTGVVTEARMLRDEGALDDHERMWLEEVYDWLNANLPCPPFGTEPRLCDGVCWFKSDAGEPLRRMWDLVALLRGNGVPVRVLRSPNPGRVLYEDAYQVVVEEWRRI